MDRAPGPLFIRADAGTRIGSGHVMRCLALAQAWAEAGGGIRFALADQAPAVEERLVSEGMRVTYLRTAGDLAADARETASLALHDGASWVVVDGYHFDYEYQRMLRDAGLQTLFVDDYGHCAHYCANLVLNHNVYADESLYPQRALHTRLLMGPRYALLRREFWAYKGRERTTPDVAHRLLVTLGGSDPNNVTLKVIESLCEASIEGLETVVVAGPSNPHHASLANAVRDPSLQVRLMRRVTSMADLLDWAELAVSGGGTTCAELAFMGVPAAIVVLADNQRRVAEGLEQAGVAVALGWHGDVTAETISREVLRLARDSARRAEMAARGRKLIDGNGAHRVVAHLRADGPLRARAATKGDEELLFRWANDPLTRQMSFRTQTIRWEEHREWFSQVLSNPDVRLMIVEVCEDGKWVPVGQVRVDDDYGVSISVAPDHRGKRLGARVLATALAHCDDLAQDAPLTAYVKPENHASQRVFDQAGFRLQGLATLRGQQCLVYTESAAGVRDE